MSQTYKWGDPVYVETGAHGRCKGIIIGPNDDYFPLVSLMLDERVSQIDRANFPLRDISPRVVEPAPRTWRLPEVGDTIRVIEKAYKTFWQELEITKVLWGSAFPIHAGGGVYDLSSIQLVRLHDDLTAEEPAAKDPWSGPCDPIGDLKSQMSRDKEPWATNPPAEPISGDHIVDANKKVEPKFHPLSGGWIPKLGLRVVYVGDTKEDPLHGKAGEISAINDSVVDVVMDHDGAEYSIQQRCLCLESEWQEDHVAGAGKVIEEPSDPVHHPRHYNTHPSGIECIEVARHFNFNIGNVIKYVWRCDEKDAPIQDLEKAAWYLNDEIERRKKGRS